MKWLAHITVTLYQNGHLPLPPPLPPPPQSSLKPSQLFVPVSHHRHLPLCGRRGDWPSQGVESAGAEWPWCPLQSGRRRPRWDRPCLHISPTTTPTSYKPTDIQIFIPPLSLYPGPVLTIWRQYICQFFPRLPNYTFTNWHTDLKRANCDSFLNYT